MSEVETFFNELMFGSGAWLGLILVLSIALLVSRINKYASPIFIMILIMMGFNYLEQIGGLISLDNNFAWAFIIDMMAIVVLTLIFLHDIRIIGGK